MKNTRLMIPLVGEMDCYVSDGPDPEWVTEAADSILEAVYRRYCEKEVMFVRPDEVYREIRKSITEEIRKN